MAEKQETAFKKLPLNEKGELIKNNYSIKSPRNMIVVSYPKMGKTLTMANTKNFLIGDCEGGTKDFGFGVDNISDMTLSSGEGFTKIKQGYVPTAIFETVDELNRANRMKDYWKLQEQLSLARSEDEKKRFYEQIIEHLQSIPFPIFAVDTITSIQKLSNDAALYEYNLKMAADKKKSDIKRVDDYGGVQYIRRQFGVTKNFIEYNAAPFIIWSGHIAQKKKILKKAEDEISAVDIALDGLLSNIFTAHASANCIFYRNEDGCFLDFTKKEESDLGSRPQHLSNKVIKIADLVPEGGTLPQTHWKTIYPELNF